LGREIAGQNEEGRSRWKAGIGEFHDEFMMFLICNSNSLGDFEILALDPLLDDGLLDVLLIRKSNLPEFIMLVTLALRGEHSNDPHNPLLDE
jgi:diacylglycerol kinase (ATP)